MASTAAMTLDSDNEFDYDFDAEEEELLFQLASGNDHTPQNNARLAAIDAVPERTDRVFDQDDLSTIGASEYTLGRTETGQSSDLYRGQAFNQRESSSGLQTPPVAASNEDVYYPDLSKALTNLKPKSSLSESTITAGRSEANQDESYDDDRSPIQRFRSYPKRPLTVTDLTSGAWCELQYWYTLTRLPGGRRTRTAAMKKGSKIHKKLEDEVHTTVKIDIMTKEDAFGLRLWNLVQGLRTLRDTGLTRELEVWGMVDENLVNGVIDSVSYENPNPEFEAELSSQESETSKRQSSLTDYFPSKKGAANHSGPKIYLADVKTRGSASPVSNAQIRPAKIQLLLYHHFLSEMAAGRLDFLKVFRRYGLDADDAFSDTFIAQVGSLHDEIFVDASETETEFTQENPSSSFRSFSSIGPDLLQYRTLRELLPLVQQEIDLAFPYGEHSMGHMLRVQYVHRDDGREIDLHDFPVSKQALETYLSNYMEWWKGRREAKGVDIEEAFKCRTCEFVDDCSWRQSMDEEMLQRARNSQKKRATRRASNNAA